MEKITIQNASTEQLKIWINESHIKEDLHNQRLSDLDKTAKTVIKMVESRKRPLAKAISGIMLNRNAMVEELAKRRNNQEQSF